MRWLLCLILLAFDCSAEGLRHYVFFNRDRERIRDTGFLETKGFEGAQLKYTWRELEPEKDRYDFKGMADDLQFLQSKGKKLFVQLQDSSFDDAIILVPAYLLKEAEYHGGAARQYNTPDDDDSRAKPEGWVSRRWDPAVQKRFEKLLLALANEFDGKIEGINLPETSVGFGESGKLYPKGFTPEVYRDAVLTNMMMLKRAFRKSVAMQYANFMPGEWLPETDRSFLKTVYKRAVEAGVGMGGPDLLPYKPGQMKHCYPLLREASGKIPTGIAVQWGNYEHVNPKTGRRTTVPELTDFAQNYLKVKYVFWCTQEPFYAETVLPYLRREK